MEPPHRKQLKYLKELDSLQLIMLALHHLLSSELFAADMGNPWRDALVDELWKRTKK